MKKLLLTLALCLFCTLLLADDKIFANGEIMIFPKSVTGRQMCSAIIITQNRHAIVFDGGYEADAAHIVELVKQYTDTIDYWFLTHAHDDHCYAFLEFFNQTPQPLKVNNVLYSFPPTDWLVKNEECFKAELEKITTCINNINVPKTIVHKGDCFEVDGVKLNVLNDYDLNFTRDAGNNSSIVCMAEISGKRYLNPGDIGLEMSQKLIKECGDGLKADIVLMVHHGQGGAQKDFYEKVRPEIAVWQTPTWLWENNNGNGPGSGPYTTNYVKCWLQDLKVLRQFRNVEDIILE